MNSRPDMLNKFFLPVSAKISHKAKELSEREIALKSIRESGDREKTEGALQLDFEILIRNIYTFYPLLIKYVDLHRVYWLKNTDDQSESLYNHVAEVFSLWLKSKMFKREEINFVASNDIDNMLLIMPNAVSSGLMSPGASHEPKSKSHGKKRKAKAGGEKKRFTSLIVACLKRMIPIGMNFFGGKEQELIQMAKQKFIDMKLGNFTSLSPAAMAKLKASQNTPSASGNDDSSNLEVNKDQEDVVEDFTRRYLKSSEPADDDASFVNETIDKVTYKKTKWQRVLYRKIGTKRHLTMKNLTQEDVIIRIMDIAKVLFGLHMVEHPLVKTKGVWRKLISGQRKKAVMACFRMAPLYSIAHHRAINLFLKAYKANWLDREDKNEPDIGFLVPDLCPELSESAKPIENAGEAEPAEGAVAVSEDKKAAEEAANGAVDVVEPILTPDPLRQLITCFNRAATTEQVATGSGNAKAASLSDDKLYMCYAVIMSRSCEIVDDDDESEPAPENGAEEEDPSNVQQEQEMQKQKLLYEQGRLAERGVAEMALLYISASKGEKTEMLEKTLLLGISLLHGGNTAVQARMLKHLKEKKDVGFFTSMAKLMSQCSVLDLDTFERCIKAEQFGGVTTDDSGSAGKKNLHDAEFTCSLFRFLQLLCEGHNLEFQNYLRSQTGNNTIVNTIICTVDYLLRLQESLMDFYWHYSGKSTVDAAGKDNFCKAITVAKQVFNTLTEYIQGPCVGNQLTLAHSRLWDAIGGFLFIFANLQDKLSKDPHQIELLRELMTLQKDMIIMLLSMLEGNVLNGPIGKQMVDTLIENQQNVEMLLKFFDIFLKMKDLTTSDAFKEFDTNGDGIISPKEFRKAMEAQKMYSAEEIDYILMCVDTNLDGKIEFNEFTERFHNPAKDIGFNMAVLLTNLSEHMSHDVRLDRLMKKASGFLAFFEPYLGRIEITGSSGRIERVYFEIKESNIEQWNKPQIKESKRQFLYDIVNEGDDKEKLEQFVNFCEDSIFEMQHAASMSQSSEEEFTGSGGGGEGSKSLLRTGFEYTKSAVVSVVQTLSPNRLKIFYSELAKMNKFELCKYFLKINLNLAFFVFNLIYMLISLVLRCIYLMILGSKENKPQLPLTGQNNLKKMKIPEGTDPSPGAVTYEVHEGVETQLKPVGLERSATISEGMTQHLENLDESQTSDSQVAITEANRHEEETLAETSKPKINEKTSMSDESEDESIKPQPAATSTASTSSNYKKLLSTLARNYYKLKYFALVLAFLINFLMLFYKARSISQKELNGETTDGLGGDEGEEEDLVEIIMMDPDEYYIEYMLKVFAMVHTITAFAIMVSYYILKVPLVIFKREKEIARKLEFDGMWIAEQPSDDDLRSHWDKLVISTKTYPQMYWDKFVKKKVKTKYCEQFELEQLCKLLGIKATDDSYKSKDLKASSKEAPKQTGLIAR